MKKVFSKPQVGTTLTVTTDWTDYFRAFDVTTLRRKSYTGTVVSSAKYDDPESFRMTTGDSSFPIRTIDLNRVVSLIDSNGINGDMKIKKKIEITSWEVKSDSRKGGFYTVTREGEHFSCTCVGYGFRKSCRHVLRIKEKVA